MAILRSTVERIIEELERESRTGRNNLDSERNVEVSLRDVMNHGEASDHIRRGIVRFALSLIGVGAHVNCDDDIARYQKPLETLFAEAREFFPNLALTDDESVRKFARLIASRARLMMAKDLGV